MLTLMPNKACEALTSEAGNIFAGTEKLRLFKSTFTPGPASVLADFIANEVNFTGYGAVTLTGSWNLGLADDGNVILWYFLAASFIQSGTTDVDVAGGWWIDDGAGTPTTLISAGVFDAPFAFNKIGNTLQMLPRMEFPISSDANVSTSVGP